MLGTETQLIDGAVPFVILMMMSTPRYLTDTNIQDEMVVEKLLNFVP